MTDVCSACHELGKPIRARGLCAACYQQWRKTGSTERVRMKRGMCTVEGCDKPAHGRGLCHQHLARLRRLGSVELPDVPREKPLTEYDLYPQWVDFKRERNPRPVIQAWKDDFFTFLAAVGDRPSKRHRLYRIDKAQPMGPGNFEWREALVEKRAGESKRDYNIRAAKAHRTEFKEEYRNNDLVRMYGIDSAAYAEMSEKQGGRCAICGDEETYIRYGKVVALAVDHDHATGAVRKLLCQRCNKAVGFLLESPQRAVNVAAYLVGYDKPLPTLPPALLPVAQS